MNREERNKGIVITVQIAVLVMTAGFVLALFTNGSGSSGSAAAGSGSTSYHPRSAVRPCSVGRAR